MTHVELESWIAKTLILLKSPSEDSAEELRSMLVETIHQKYNGRKQFKMIPLITGSENIDKNRFKDSSSLSSSDPKQKISPGGFSPSVTISPDSYSSDCDSSSSNSEMVILEEDTICTVCREGIYTQWNQLMECADCHVVYHQQCHNPPIPESDASDPRVVWYCRHCTKTLNKQKTSSLSSSSQSSKSSSSSKVLSGRSNTSSPSFGNKPFGGVSVSTKKSSSSKSSHSSSNKSHIPNINIISADKRLQIMKKKAARKQEKRPK